MVKYDVINKAEGASWYFPIVVVIQADKENNIVLHPGTLCLPMFDIVFVMSG